MSHAEPLRAQGDMRFASLCIVLLWSCSVACRGAGVDDSQERCAQTTAQIDEALQSYIDSGFLVPGAMPCELTPESFDSRVRRQNVELVLGQFQAACAQQDACCSGACLPTETPADDPPERLPPPAAPPPYVKASRSAAGDPL